MISVVCGCDCVQCAEICFQLISQTLSQASSGAQPSSVGTPNRLLETLSGAEMPVLPASSCSRCALEGVGVLADTLLLVVDGRVGTILESQLRNVSSARDTRGDQNGEYDVIVKPCDAITLRPF